jgi:hypothetical protein
LKAALTSLCVILGVLPAQASLKFTMFGIGLRLLVGGGEGESLAAFGQMIPIVMVFAVTFPIYNVIRGEFTESSKITKH